MIRLRCEMGPPLRQTINNDRTGDHEWIKMARCCAALQARSIITKHQKIVPLPLLTVVDLSPLTLCFDGVLEPLTWEASSTGAITRLRRADLSFAAAQVLVQTNQLPRCFLPALLAHDLLQDASLRVPGVEANLLAEEFAAWITCSDLSSDDIGKQF